MTLFHIYNGNYRLDINAKKLKTYDDLDKALNEMARLRVKYKTDEYYVVEDFIKES